LRVTDLAPWLNDFADTAAAMSQLDLIVTIDTSVAHLAGALGRPVWVMLPDVPDWRYMLHREDSPWYPTMRLFRQGQAGDWAAVVQRVASELESLAASRLLSSAAA
jgi:ADP-heptose:LPS heptosyltransferase